MRRLILFLLLCLAISVNSQTIDEVQHFISESKTPDSLFVNNYIDSLLTAKQNIVIDSNKKYKPISSSSFDYAMLFLPLTYNHSIVKNQFMYSGHKNTLLDRTLLHIYLEKPYLVKTTASYLRYQHSISVDVDKPIRHNVEIVEALAPKPIETEAAPVNIMIVKPNFWSVHSEGSLQLLQNYVSSNWYQGGESNYAILSSAILNVDYNNHQKLKWDNCLELKFGLQSSKSDKLHSFKTTDDLIRLTSKLGLKASKCWYYTVQFMTYTQFYHSFRSNDSNIYSDFLAPLNVNISFGMAYSIDWFNHKLKGNIHLAPFAYNMKYTRLPYLSERLGIDKNRSVRNDFGSELIIDYEWNLLESLTWKTRLYTYTAYDRIEFDWENTFKFQFNRYIGAQIFIYPRFDDGAKRDTFYGHWQLKEFASIGFQYIF